MTMNWNPDKLNDLEETKCYQLEIEGKLRKEEQPVGVDERWRWIESAVREAAEKTKGVRRCGRKQEWFNEDCRRAIVDKNRVRAAMI